METMLQKIQNIQVNLDTMSGSVNYHKNQKSKVVTWYFWNHGKFYPNTFQYRASVEGVNNKSIM